VWRNAAWALCTHSSVVFAALVVVKPLFKVIYVNCVAKNKTKHEAEGKQSVVGLRCIFHPFTSQFLRLTLK
jgi:hypothetical protein